jgi:hypothetical protein
MAPAGRDDHDHHVERRNSNSSQRKIGSRLTKRNSAVAGIPVSELDSSYFVLNLGMAKPVSGYDGFARRRQPLRFRKRHG